MNTSANSPHSPQRLALDLQRARDELELERQRTHQLLDEIDRQNAELDRLRSSVHREANSRLLAEEALDESRERLQLAVEAAGLALWDWHLKSPQIFMTARWGEMIGDVAIDGYWAYDTLMDRIHPDDRSRIEVASKKLAEVRSTKLVSEYRVRSGDGWIWVESHGMVAEHDSQGRPLRLMGTLADISERKRIEADMQRARDQAEQANRAKTEFLANTSHEIRTPLNALMGLTQLLMDSPVNAEQRSWLELMDSSAHTLLNMLNDVLDLSRIEAGKMDVERVRYELPGRSSGRWPWPVICRSGWWVIPEGFARCWATCCRTPSSSPRKAGGSACQPPHKQMCEAARRCDCRCRTVAWGLPQNTRRGSLRRSRRPTRRPRVAMAAVVWA